jgi:hypothetical protein
LAIKVALVSFIDGGNDGMRGGSIRKEIALLEYA